jgi:DNA-binding response OmpR family regulator
MAEKVRILVVDDEESISEFVKRVLELEGYDVTTAADGESALAHLSEQAPDLVLLDIKMPGLNGYQVLARIRETSSVPVMMLTAVREGTAMERSLGLGASDYLIKPVSVKVLIARIKAKLRRSKI